MLNEANLYEGESKHDMVVDLLSKRPPPSRFRNPSFCTHPLFSHTHIHTILVVLGFLPHLLMYKGRNNAASVAPREREGAEAETACLSHSLPTPPPRRPSPPYPPLLPPPTLGKFASLALISSNKPFLSTTDQSIHSHHASK